VSRYSNEVGRALATAMQAQRAEADAQHEIERLRAEVAQRTAERDDARTLFCMNHPLVVSGDNEARDVARRHGWDCFDATHATDGRVQNGGA
jgi:ABC-type hemin transport system substrate-binding protein